MGARLRGEEERSGVGMKSDGERRVAGGQWLDIHGWGGGWGCGGGRERKVGVMEKPAMDVGEETRGTKRGEKFNYQQRRE